MPSAKARDLFGDTEGIGSAGQADYSAADWSQAPGVLPAQEIKRLIERRSIRSEVQIESTQIQPASLDLRLGRLAYRIHASFFPRRDTPVSARIGELKAHQFFLTDGAVLERNGVYLIELEEALALSDVYSGAANPKSSTGRLDIFTRLVTDGADVFDVVRPAYKGKLWAEVSPRTFSVRVKRGIRLNQIRFRRRAPNQMDYQTFFLSDKELGEIHQKVPLVDDDAIIRNGLNIRVNLDRTNSSTIIGFRAKKHTAVVDLALINHYEVEKFWEPLYYTPSKQLLLEPGAFYILASKEKMHIPGNLAAEMVAFDPMLGEFRVHYAGFFDPGFGRSPGGPGSRAVLEVRTHDMPFLLEDGQTIGRLVFESLTANPAISYGEGISSSYQGQGLKLSKHFRPLSGN
jgi:dCTP deaminase